jgi:hypothetical protein
MSYKPLTKAITDERGRETAVCILYGTEQCRKIHTSKGCEGCPVFEAILTQLRTFEEIYLGTEKED